MHTTKSISKAVRSWTCSHVIWVKSTTSTTTRSYREVLLTFKKTFLLVCTSNWVLKTSWVCRVTSDRNINTFVPHDCNTFTNIVCTVTFYAQTFWIVSVRDFFYNCQSLVCTLTVKVVKLSLNVSKTVDTRDDLSSVFTKTVQDNAKLVLTNVVSLSSDFDSTFSSSKRFVSCQECETLCFFRKKTSTKVSVTKTNFAVISYRTWQTECLKSLTNVSSSCRS